MFIVSQMKIYYTNSVYRSNGYAIFSIQSNIEYVFLRRKNPGKLSGLFN